MPGHRKVNFFDFTVLLYLRPWWRVLNIAIVVGLSSLLRGSKGMFILLMREGVRMRRVGSFIGCVGGVIILSLCLFELEWPVVCSCIQNERRGWIMKK